jgi:hypothetical protein
MEERFEVIKKYKNISNQKKLQLSYTFLAIVQKFIIFFVAKFKINKS